MYDPEPKTLQPEIKTKAEARDRRRRDVQLAVDLPSMKLDTGLSIWKNRWTIRRTAADGVWRQGWTDGHSALERYSQTRGGPPAVAR
jgi:hypothetical protein